MLNGRDTLDAFLALSCIFAHLYIGHSPYCVFVGCCEPMAANQFFHKWDNTDRLDSYLSVIKTSAVHMSTVCLSKVWFSNRRAKWRRETKQRSGTQSECVCFWIRGPETICVTLSFNPRQDELIWVESSKLTKNVFLLYRRSKAKRFSSCESSAAARLHISAGTDGSNSL